MGHLIFEHAAGREVYGDEPRYSEEYLAGDGPFHKGENGNLISGVCDPNNLIERRVSPLQFGADGRLILKPRDPAACAKLMATIDRILGVENVALDATAKP